MPITSGEETVIALNTPMFEKLSGARVGTASPNNIAENATWFVMDGKYVYAISQGSYDSSNNDSPVLDIFLIQDNEVKLMSSTTIPITGVQARGIDYYGTYVYVGAVAGETYIYDTKDKKNPVLVASFSRASTVGLQMLHIINGVLCFPGWTYKMDFYSLESPVEPKHIKSIDLSWNQTSFSQMLQDGDIMWCVAHTSHPSEFSLIAIDITDKTDPVLLSTTAIPEVKNARYGVIDDGMMYVGGFSSDSNVCRIDISDPKKPILVHKFTFNLSSFVKIGNKLVGYDGADSTNPNNNRIVEWDISDPASPIETALLNEGEYIFYPQNYGNKIIAFEGGKLGKPQGATPNDSAKGQQLNLFKYTPVHLDGATIDHLAGKKGIFQDVTVQNDMRANGLQAGRNGLLSAGPIVAPYMSSIFSGAETVATGVYSRKASYAGIKSFANSVNPPKIFRISTDGVSVINCVFKLKIMAHENQAKGGNGKVSYAEYIFAGYLNSNKTPPTFTKHIPVSTYGTPFHQNAGVSLNVALEDAIANDSNFYITVHSPDMAASGAMILAELECIEAVGIGKKESLIVSKVDV